MVAIQYLDGDATRPQGNGVKIIAHVCNDVGRWGRGFVLSVSARWPQPELAYLDWYRHRKKNGFGLGAVQFVLVEKDVWVANMVGQRGRKGRSRTPPICYDALENCLAIVREKAFELHASVHMPRNGCLAGGKWRLLEPIVVKALTKRGIAVVVYD